MIYKHWTQPKKQDEVIYTYTNEENLRSLVVSCNTARS